MTMWMSLEGTMLNEVRHTNENCLPPSAELGQTNGKKGERRAAELPYSTVPRAIYHVRHRKFPKRTDFKYSYHTHRKC